MKQPKIIEMGGWSLIALSILHYGVLLYLAMEHNYPRLLFGSGDTALTNLAASLDNLPLIATLSVYPLLLLLLIPAGVASYHALKDTCEGTMQISTYFISLGTIALILCALRWPSLNLVLAKAYAAATVAQKPMLGELYNALNTYLGLYVGDVLGKTCFGLWVFCVSIAVIASKRFTTWIGYLGLATSAVIFVILVSRFYTPLSDLIVGWHLPMLVPAWFLIYGCGLLVYRRQN